MSGFISALIKERKAAKKAAPDTMGRFNEIIGIIRKHDYDDGITPEIVVTIIQDLGPTFVKIGQIASQQSEYIPPAYCDALAKLRSSVAPMDIETVHAQIEKYLGKPVDEVFASFDEKPLGAASIGQVHRAVLFDGTVVAVKVRRPGVVETVARDFALLENILDTFAKDGISGIDVKGLIVELEKTSKIELDFTNEAAYLERFWNNNSQRPGIESPKCYRDLTNEAILTEDFVTGREVGDAAYLDTLDEGERDRIAALVADNFASQVLVDGFYHADPHSGNVLVNDHVPVASAAEKASATKKGSEHPELELPNHSIEWIDFGMMGQLSDQQRQILLDLVTSVVMQDAYGLKRTVLKVAQPTGEVDHGALLEMCEDMCGQYTGGDFGDFELGDLLGTVISSLQEESYKIDPFLTNLARGIVAVEGTVKALSPRVNILNYFIDKVDTGIGFDLDLENIGEDALTELTGPLAIELLKFLNNTSKSTAKTAETLDMLEKGQIRLHSDFDFGQKATDSLFDIVKFAVEGLMVIALFVGSCLLCTVSPNAMESSATLRVVFPEMGFVGYLLSVLLAFMLFRSVKKDKK